MAESLMKTHGRPSEAIMEAIEATVIDPKANLRPGREKALRFLLS
jgi:hypothetical protein